MGWKGTYGVFGSGNYGHCMGFWEVIIDDEDCIVLGIKRTKVMIIK